MNRNENRAVAVSVGSSIDPQGMADLSSLRSHIGALSSLVDRYEQALRTQAREGEAAQPRSDPRLGGNTATSRLILAREMLAQRRARTTFFDRDLLAEPAWDMLLDLYVAHATAKKVSVSSLCVAATVPTTTALRWIRALVDRGLFEREDDPHDGRRSFVRLSPTTLDRLEAYLDRVSTASGGPDLRGKAEPTA